MRRKFSLRQKLLRGSAISTTHSWGGIFCRVWMQSCFSNKYGQLRGHGESALAHRLSWVDTRGPIPKGKRVLHRCDNRPCIEERHLFLGGPQDNTDDMMRKKRHSYVSFHGVDHGMAVLSDLDVIAIRSVPPRHGIKVALARKYGVSPSQIGKVLRRVCWRHIP